MTHQRPYFTTDDFVHVPGGVDCKDLYDQGSRSDGVYSINPDGGEAFDVYCDMTNGGWTIIQRRIDTTDFYKGWADYVAGFGDLSGSMWLGLDKIHRLTTTAVHLTVDITITSNVVDSMLYTSFSVADSSKDYKLTVYGYTSARMDKLTYPELPTTPELQEFTPEVVS